MVPVIFRRRYFGRHAQSQLGRREFIALCSTCCWLARNVRSMSMPQYGLMERTTLDLGHRGSRAGPVATLADGSLLWVTTEPEPPYLARAMWAISRLTMRRSTDGGRSWGEPHVIMRGTRNYSLLSHTLRLSQSGALLHIFVRYSGYDYETASPARSLAEVFVQRSMDGGRTWSEARKVSTGERYNADVLSLEQLRDGRLVYPFAFLTASQGRFSSSAMYSDDEGLTWIRAQSSLQVGGEGFESGASEPSVVQLPDGRLWMLIRAQTGFQWESFSKDRGETWSTAAPSILPSSNAPATALRMKSGDIAVAWNNDVRSNYARQSLVLGITRDGRSFQGLREIDFTDFPDNPADPTKHVTYPYLAETQDGVIVVSYNKGQWMRHNRPVVARVSPAWLLARQDTADFRDGRTGWHTVDPGPNGTAAVESYLSPDEDALWLEIKQSANYKGSTGILRNIPLVANGVINATVEVVKPEAYLIFGDSLLDTTNLGEACLRIHCAGNQILLAAGTPEPVRNDRRGTQFSFLSHRIKNEIPYPEPVTTRGAMEVSLRYSASQKKAEVRINGGPVVELRTGRILGLTYIGLAVANGGILRLRSISTQLNS